MVHIDMLHVMVSSTKTCYDDLEACYCHWFISKRETCQSHDKCEASAFTYAKLGNFHQAAGNNI